MCRRNGKAEEWVLLCFIFKFPFLKASWGEGQDFISFPVLFPVSGPVPGGSCLIYICPINTNWMDKWVLNHKPLKWFSTTINWSEGTSHRRQPLCYWFQNLNRKNGRRNIQLSSPLFTICLMGHPFPEVWPDEWDAGSEEGYWGSREKESMMTTPLDYPPRAHCVPC